MYLSAYLLSTYVVLRVCLAWCVSTAFTSWCTNEVSAAFLCSFISMCACVFSALFQSAIPLVRTEFLFPFQMLIPHYVSLFFTLPALYTEVPSLYRNTNIATRTHKHTLSCSLLFTSDVVLSVLPPVDHLVVVIEEVFCNASIGPISGTRSIK